MVVHLWLIYDHILSLIWGRVTSFLKISHYTNCATGRSHASTVWPKKKSRLWVQIQILKLLLTIKLTRGSSKHTWRVRAFQLYLPGHLLSCHLGILPMYLPRDWFLPSELVVPLVAQCHQSTTVHSYGPSGELERHYPFIHPPLPRFRRNRDRLHEKSTQTCQVTQTWIFYFRQIIRWRQWAIWRFRTYRTDPTSFGHWLLWWNNCHRHLLWQ
jgi:hypothetical protein